MRLSWRRAPPAAVAVLIFLLLCACPALAAGLPQVNLPGLARQELALPFLATAAATAAAVTAAVIAAQKEEEGELASQRQPEPEAEPTLMELLGSWTGVLRYLGAFLDAEGSCHVLIKKIKTIRNGVRTSYDSFGVEIRFSQNNEPLLEKIAREVLPFYGLETSAAIVPDSREGRPEGLHSRGSSNYNLRLNACWDEANKVGAYNIDKLLAFCEDLQPYCATKFDQVGHLVGVLRRLHRANPGAGVAAGGLWHSRGAALPEAVKDDREEAVAQMEGLHTDILPVTDPLRIAVCRHPIYIATQLETDGNIRFRFLYVLAWSNRSRPKTPVHLIITFAQDSSPDQLEAMREAIPVPPGFQPSDVPVTAQLSYCARESLDFLFECQAAFGVMQRLRYAVVQSLIEPVVSREVSRGQGVERYRLPPDIVAEFRARAAACPRPPGVAIFSPPHGDCDEFAPRPLYSFEE